MKNEIFPPFNLPPQEVKTIISFLEEHEKINFSQVNQSFNFFMNLHYFNTSYAKALKFDQSYKNLNGEMIKCIDEYIRSFELSFLDQLMLIPSIITPVDSRALQTLRVLTTLWAISRLTYRLPKLFNSIDEKPITAFSMIITTLLALFVVYAVISLNVLFQRGILNRQAELRNMDARDWDKLVETLLPITVHRLPESTLETTFNKSGEPITIGMMKQRLGLFKTTASNRRSVLEEQIQEQRTEIHAQKILRLEGLTEMEKILARHSYLKSQESNAEPAFELLFK